MYNPKMKKPSLPRKPIEPKHPVNESLNLETYYSVNTDLSKFDEGTVKDIFDYYQDKNIPFQDVKIFSDHYYEGGIVYFKHTETLLKTQAKLNQEKSSFDKKMVSYDRNYKKYKEKMKLYEKAFADHLAHMLAYDENNAQILKNKELKTLRRLAAKYPNE